MCRINEDREYRARFISNSVRGNVADVCNFKNKE